MIERAITSKLKEMLEKFPIVSVTGPRQSGKSTLLKSEFPDYTYVSLEDPDVLIAAREDPRAFLDTYGRHTVIDEVQQCPELFPYLQTKVDQTGDSGQYILSGSQNFLLMEKISESLAGRVYIMTLLPFSYDEISGIEAPHNEKVGIGAPRNEKVSIGAPRNEKAVTGTLRNEKAIIGAPRDEKAVTNELSTVDWIFTGGYPRIYDKSIDPADYYPSYVQTYLERDVRSIKRIVDYARFTRFIRLCASRAGQVLNVSSLASDAGITAVTANEWLSILESSYIIFRLFPYYKNFGKRLIKSPKLYFYDTGLLCSLLGIKSSEDLESSEMYGQLFENMVISEQKKAALSGGMSEELYYWRDSNGVEVDLLAECGKGIRLSEIKSSKTMDSHYAKNLAVVGDRVGASKENRFVIYDGTMNLQSKDAVFVPWRNTLSQ